MIYLQNKYTKCYYKIISLAKNRADNFGYVERHHIIPECFYQTRSRAGRLGPLTGDPNLPDNLVLLTPREHFICHLLLTKMVTGKLKSKMHLALLKMSVSTKGQNRYRVNSNTYATIRKNASISMSGKNNPMYGRKRTAQEIENIKIGLANSSYKAGPISEEHKAAISKSNKGKARPAHVVAAMVAGRKAYSFDNNSGKHWYNNGLNSVLVKECPPGYVLGRLSIK